MAEESLKDFLRQQARGLDSLLELTPAKHMFSEDNSDQWKRKKQTPEQKKAARLAKLDPANWKSAKDVYDERSAEAAKKRKREEQSDKDNGEEATKSEHAPPSKKQKKPLQIDKKIAEKADDEAIENANLRKKLKKRKNRLERNQKERERREADLKKTGDAKQNLPLDLPNTTSAKQSIPNNQSEVKSSKRKHTESKPDPQVSIYSQSSREQPAHGAPTLIEESDVESVIDEEDDTKLSDEIVSDGGVNDDNGDQDEVMSDDASTATSSEDMPDILSPVHDSASSSVSSIQPTTQIQTSATASKSKLSTQSLTDSPSESTLSKPIQSEADREAARQRLQSQISQFRSERKADNRPVQTRAELLDQRRRKEAERKAAKKEQRRKEKEEEARMQDEEIARRFSPGGSVTGSLLGSPRSPMIDDDSGTNAFTFGRIAFADGSSFDPVTKQAADAKKRKGPSDTASALKAAQAKQGRIAGLDEEKKSEIAEKDMWLNARKRAHGEKVKDDTSLLKKALKRQEKDKKKSSKEWVTRTDGVQAAQDKKQKRRNDNLQKRKDEKGTKKPSKPKRAGFEGSFKGRTGKSKK